MKNKKKLGIIFGIIYYLFWILLAYLSFIVNMLDGVINLFSSVLFIISIFIIPILFILLPFIFKKLLKKEWYKAFVYSFIINVIYIIIIVPVIRFGIISYMKSFSIKKWNNYDNLRYLMIDDLEKNHNLIGMKKDDVNKLLGKEDSNYEGMCYFVKSEFLDSYFYCLKYDENNIITETFKTYKD